MCSCSECVDSDNGAADSFGDSCAEYTAEAELGWTTYDENWCGGYDDDDFDSMTMCCVCMEEGIERWRYIF